VHVLVEKPLAASLADCGAMIAAAKKTGVTLGVISQRRFYEPVARMKAAIDAGKIGKPSLGVFIQYSWRDAAYYLSDSWRGKWDTEGGGVLVNQSPHQLDILLWLMGPAAEVSGQWANVNHPGVEVDDTAVASIKFVNGGLGSIATSVSQKPGIYTKVHIHGSSGASVGVETDRGATFIAGVSAVAEPPLNDIWTIPGEEHRLAEFQSEDRNRFASMDATVHYHKLQIADFLASIREGRPPLVTAEAGRAVVELFTAIYRSAREGKPVKLPISPAGS
ncbi:MAG: Gfo/Idh/MocA family oxidoreductase, partial [Gemmataceae bacterium]